ncbi:hypothetical protein CCICO_09305 [Corynebacterium ciconiae DSM 44920]|uniref:YwqG family protein n=1 Tax=Corynebacterium ciconiae TaxID=227319 RepID=UPI0003667988|nr:YwqG family protein [Corynebacterium ciconiae]WKD61869.1 hypothetical protein CCICO_09305 [Corynebacterium ciconiae DSM 44920]
MDTKYERILARLKEQTATQSITIEFNGRPSSLQSSAVGGQPYLDPGEEAPRSADGAPMVFLAQINLAELPANDLLPGTGMLQFFIGSDDLLGATDFEDMRKNSFRVIHRDSIDPSVTTSAYALPEDANHPFDSTEGVGLAFSLGQQAITFEDYRFDDALERAVMDEIDDTDDPDAVIDECRDIFYDIPTVDGHHIGGYPRLLQDDPRTEEEDLDVLLLQIDTEEPIMWGDLGVGTFFISAADLKALGFSRVGYTWCCC